MIVHQMVGGLKSGMAYCGLRHHSGIAAENPLRPHHGAGLRESHVHDVMITREAPNYAAE